MDKILFINACVRPKSRTHQLAETVLSQLQGQVCEVNLEKEQLQSLTQETLCQRDELLAQNALDAPMLKYAKEFSEADIIVVAAPYWDLLFPASVRTYFEHVTVSGVTFYYNDQGIPQSLCRAKRLVYVATSGGPVFGENLGYTYIKAVANGFFGIQDTMYFDAQGLDIWGADVETIMKEAKENIRKVLS